MGFFFFLFVCLFDRSQSYVLFIHENLNIENLGKQQIFSEKTKKTLLVPDDGSDAMFDDATDTHSSSLSF